MEKQTAEREELYTRVPPPGPPLRINVDPFDVNDAVPNEAEIREAAKRLRNGRAAGALHIRAEDVKEWLAGMVQEETDETGGSDNAGDP
jgi:hypothetical protein